MAQDGVPDSKRPHTTGLGQDPKGSIPDPGAQPPKMLPCVPPTGGWTRPLGAFSHSARTARAQRAHSANYYGDYPGNSPENDPPTESCTTNSNLKNSNI